jgi:hypothetical protein
MLLSKGLFARKFDYMNNASLAMMDELDKQVDFSEQMFRKLGQGAEGPTGALQTHTSFGDSELERGNVSVMITMGSRPNETSDCLDTSSDSYIRVKRCDANKESQWFQLGPCVLSGNIETRSAQYQIVDGQPLYFSGHNIPAGNAMVPELPLCLIKQKTQHQQESRCVDLLHGIVNKTSHIIVYNCLGSWNQMVELRRNGGFSITHPGIYGHNRGNGNKDMTSCLSVQGSNGNTGDGRSLIAEPCTEEHHSTLLDNMIFSFVREGGDAKAQFTQELDLTDVIGKSGTLWDKEYKKARGKEESDSGLHATMMLTSLQDKLERARALK